MHLYSKFNDKRLKSLKSQEENINNKSNNEQKTTYILEIDITKIIFVDPMEIEGFSHVYWINNYTTDISLNLFFISDLQNGIVKKSTLLSSPVLDFFKNNILKKVLFCFVVLWFILKPQQEVFAMKKSNPNFIQKEQINFRNLQITKRPRLENDLPEITTSIESLPNPDKIEFTLNSPKLAIKENQTANLLKITAKKMRSSYTSEETKIAGFGIKYFKYVAPSSYVDKDLQLDSQYSTQNSEIKDYKIINLTNEINNDIMPALKNEYKTPEEIDAYKQACKHYKAVSLDLIAAEETGKYDFKTPPPKADQKKLDNFFKQTQAINDIKDQKEADNFVKNTHEENKSKFVFLLVGELGQSEPMSKQQVNTFNEVAKKSSVAGANKVVFIEHHKVYKAQADFDPNPLSTRYNQFSKGVPYKFLNNWYNKTNQSEIINKLGEVLGSFETGERTQSERDTYQLGAQVIVFSATMQDKINNPPNSNNSTPRSELSESSESSKSSQLGKKRKLSFNPNAKPEKPLNRQWFLRHEYNDNSVASMGTIALVTQSNQSANRFQTKLHKDKNHLSTISDPEAAELKKQLSENEKYILYTQKEMIDSMPINDKNNSENAQQNKNMLTQTYENIKNEYDKKNNK